MKHFLYYLYENLNDATENDYNPRKWLTAQIDPIISDIVCMAPHTCNYDDIAYGYSNEIIETLIKIGVLRKENSSLLLNCTVLIEEDYPLISEHFSYFASHAADKLENIKKQIYYWIKKINNGFDPAINLYHILCGTIFDGLFFEYLSLKQIVKTSKLQPSGLDYIITIYEDCKLLENFSKKLLCSYNRYQNGPCIFQSFGDANGNRKDFYRFITMMQNNYMTNEMIPILQIWNSIKKDIPKNTLFLELKNLKETKQCQEKYHQLFSFFRYVNDNNICVPIYSKEDQPIIEKIENIIENTLFEDFKTALLTSKRIQQLTCSRHGVSLSEVANELYHIAFGLLNNELVSRKFVSAPEYFPDEGAYLKSIELI
ncbi:MAG: hypothetical protein ACOX60_07815 [Massiliimalia sp.]|jgi:hypothetical protein